MLQKNRIFNGLISLVLLSGLFVSGCDTASDNSSQSRVTLQFQTISSLSSPGTLGAAAFGQQADDTLIVEGSNGRLEIRDIRFIVEEIELKKDKDDAECENEENGEDEDDCEEMEAGPFFVDLPLQADTLNLGTDFFDPGLFEELEFEVGDVDLDEDEDDEEKQEHRELAELIRTDFPDWPDEASLVIIGNFISTENDTSSFKVFAEAEVEIEMEFDPPMEIDENTFDQIIRVKIDPRRWLLLSDDTVPDLSEFDYESTGRILEFEAKFKDGFMSVEVEDDRDDDDDDDDDEDDDDS